MSSKIIEKKKKRHTSQTYIKSDLFITSPMDALISYCQARKEEGADSGTVEKLQEDILAIQSLLYARDDGVEQQRQAKDTINNWNFTRGQGGTHYFLGGQNAQGKPTQPDAESTKALKKLNEYQMLLDSCNRTCQQHRWDMFSLWWKYVSDFLRGQTPHLRDLPGHTHIHRAAVTPHANRRKMLLRLLTAHAPINQRDKNHETALHIATRHGNLDEV